MGYSGVLPSPLVVVEPSLFSHCLTRLQLVEYLLFHATTATAMALASHQCPGMHLLIRLRGHVPLRLPLHWATGSSRALEPACLLGVVLTMKPQVMWHCGCGLQVVCKGTEERLRDCSFPENFTSRSGRRGLSETCAADQNQHLGIVCRRFTIPGVDPQLSVSDFSALASGTYCVTPSCVHCLALCSVVADWSGNRPVFLCCGTPCFPLETSTPPRSMSVGAVCAWGTGTIVP